MAAEGKDDNWQFLRPGTTVGRNQIYLRTYKLSREPETKTVVVAAWNKKTITYDNGSRQRTVATNVTIREHEITLQRGVPQKQIDLEQHNEPKQITMWLKECPDRCRWRFKHHSNPFTQSIAIDSYGDYFWKVLVDVGLWTAGGAFLAGFVCLWMLKRAGSGPRWGYAKWTLVLGLITLIGGYLWYQSLAQLVVWLPQVIALYLVFVFAIVLLETFATHDKRGLFIQPVVERAISPSGRDGYQLQQMEGEEHLLTKMPSGEWAVTKPGLLPFLSRVAGGAAILHNIDALKTRIEMPHSRWDEMFITHPMSPEVLEYEQEGWQIHIPEFDGVLDAVRWAAPGGVAMVLVYGLAASAGLTVLGWVGALAILGGMLVRPEDGFAHAAPAPAHLNEAMANMMVLSEEIDAADTIDEARQKRVTDQVKREMEVQRRVDQVAESIVEETHGTNIERLPAPNHKQSDELQELAKLVQRGEISQEEAIRRLSNGDTDGDGATVPGGDDD